jgi:hypothetical protein
MRFQAIWFSPDRPVPLATFTAVPCRGLTINETAALAVRA